MIVTVLLTMGLLSGAPLSTFQFGFNVLDYMFNVLAECFIEAASVVKGRLSQDPFRCDLSTRNLRVKIDK